MNIKELEKELTNYKNEPIVGQWQEDDEDDDAQTDREVQTEHWNSERLSE